MSNLEIEQTVLETELAVASLDRFLVNRRVTTRELLASLDPRHVNETSAVLAELLSKESAPGAVEVTEFALETEPEEGFRSIFWKRRAETGKLHTVALFKIKDSSINLALAFLSVALATQTLELATPIVGLAQALWTGLRVLKRPEDSDAIDLLEELLAHRAEAAVFKHSPHPKIRELNERIGRNTSETVQRLVSDGLLEVKTWGDQRDDISNTDNTVGLKV
jgi:hypothetical protein